MIQSNPSVITQLGPEALVQLQQLATQYQAQMAAQNAANGGAAEGADDEDDIPELVEADDDQAVPELV